MCNPIRVLQMIGSLNVGGSQTMIINILKNIDRSKVQFDFIVDSNNELYYKDLVETLGAKVYYLPRFKGNNLFEVKLAWKKFLLSHPEYKILHSHVRSYASLYIPVAKNCGLKTIIHSHSTSNGHGIEAIVKEVLQFRLRWQADYLFACSQIAGEWLYGKRATKKDNYKIIPNAINVSEYRFDNAKRDRCRNELNLKENIVFMHVGRFSKPKNHSFLIDIFNEVYKRNINSKLILVGDGPLKSEIEDKVKKLSLDNAVIFLGARDDIPGLLQAADCFLLPSLWEGLPVSAVEAQSSGIPCLISDKVTEEVFVTKCAYKLPVDSGIDCWVEKIKNLDYKRIDVSYDIYKAGFDIKDSAEWLQNFYLTLSC